MNTKEPIYEDSDEYGNPISGARGQPKWKSTAGMGYQHLLQKAFRLCSYGNKRNFGSPWEYETWKKICKKLDKGVMPEDWVEEQLKRVEEKNKDRVRIVFGQFENMVMNIERQKDWEAKHRIERGYRTDDIVEDELHDIISE